MEITATARTAIQPGGSSWHLWADPGRTVGLLGVPGGGLTRLGLSLLAEPSMRASVAVVDVRGWFSPLAAFEVGIDPERLVIVRSTERKQWPQLVAALLEGLNAVYAEVPAGISDSHLRRLAALTRSRGGALLLRPLDGRLPSGVSHISLQPEEMEWRGTVAGHGCLRRRHLRMRVWGKGVGGIERFIEVEDDGENAMRVVAGMVTPARGRAAG